MKTIIITGSTRGIGFGLAENFLKQGCKVVISSRKQIDVDACVTRLGQQYGENNVTGQSCDITNISQLEQLWQKGVDHFGQVDTWINNAGMSIKRLPLEQQSADDLANIVNTNLTGVLLANKVALKQMKKQNFGQIWNMEGFGSNGAVQAGMAAYGATKRGVNYIIKSLQKEVKGTPVQVNTLSPGIVVTDLLIGDYDTSSAQWQKAKKIFNILGDTVETVTPWLVSGILNSTKSGDKVIWLTGRKAFYRFLTAAFNKRDLFKQLEH
ncbi:SDR family NAD(P)-dependent oxidoreductase [Colwellia sp. MEBiC06753]